MLQGSMLGNVIFTYGDGHCTVLIQTVGLNNIVYLNQDIVSTWVNFITSSYNHAVHRHTQTTEGTIPGRVIKKLETTFNATAPPEILVKRFFTKSVINPVRRHGS